MNKKASSNPDPNVPLNQCHRCKYNAGVDSGKVQCLFFKRSVQRYGANWCDKQDSRQMPGKKLHPDEFAALMKENAKDKRIIPITPNRNNK